MPNWCSGSLTVSGDAKDVAAFLAAAEVKFTTEGLSDVDGLLSKFMPVPDILTKIHRGSRQIEGETFNNWIETGEGARGLTDLELSMLEREHGATDWYDWSIAHWGTKWDADATVRWTKAPTDVRLVFDTAWAPPAVWVKYVSARFPRLSFRLAYAEQGAGYAGWEDWKGGATPDDWEYEGDFYLADFDWDGDEDPMDAFVPELAEFMDRYDLHPGG